MVRGPGVESNKLLKDVVVNIDLAPTILDMAGESMPATDGVSFLPRLLGNAKSKDLIESNEVNFKYASDNSGTSLFISLSLF